MSKVYLRGDIYYADLQKGIGSEQEGFRPVVIIQNDIGNRFSPTVIVAAITSKVDVKPHLPTHCFIKDKNGLDIPSVILLEQIRTIDKKRLDKYIGHMSEEQIIVMNHALAISIGLTEQSSKPLVMCLCPTCAENFNRAGNNWLRRIDPKQAERETCTYCNSRLGYDYELIPKSKS